MIPVELLPFALVVVVAVLLVAAVTFLGRYRRRRIERSYPVPVLQALPPVEWPRPPAAPAIRRVPRRAPLDGDRGSAPSRASPDPSPPLIEFPSLRTDYPAMDSPAPSWSGGGGESGGGGASGSWDSGGSDSSSCSSDSGGGGSCDGGSSGGDS